MSFSSGSGPVTNVTPSQATVVIPTVTSMMYANSLGLSLFHFKVTCRNRDTTAATAMADTSDHALILHQNHLSIRTVPVPAPVTSSSFHAWAIEVRFLVTTIEININSTVTTWETIT